MNNAKKKKIELRNMRGIYLDCKETPINNVVRVCFTNDNIKKDIRKCEVRKKPKKTGKYVLIETTEGVRIAFDGLKVKLNTIPAEDKDMQELLILLDSLGIRNIKNDAYNHNSEFNKEIEPILKKHIRTEKILRKFDIFF